MQRKPRCRSASPKGSPKGSPKSPRAAPDVRIRFAVNTSGRCESPRPMSPSSAAAAAAAEAAPVGLMRSMGNCIGRFCSKGNKTLKPKQPSAVQASAAAAPALMMNTMPPPMQYMTPQLAKEQREAEKALEKRRMTQMKRHNQINQRRLELEEQQGALEEQQRALDEQKRNLEEEIIRVNESKREAFEKTLRKDGSNFAIQPCGACGKMLHNTSNCPSLKQHRQKIEEQQMALAEKRRSLEEQLKELLEEMGHLSHEHADGGGGAKTKRRHSKSKRSKSKSKKSKSKRARSSKRCKQCGMINCPCPGTTCKCKPIAGWEPGKGFRSHRH